MLIGIGHDLQIVPELEGREGLWSPGIFFTEAECAHARGAKSPAASITGLFSAKEAFYKAVPEMPACAWTDVEIVAGSSGAPSLRLYGPLRAHFERRGWTTRISISHSGDYASSVVAVCAAEPHAPSLARSSAPVKFEATRLPLHVRPSDLDSLGHVNNAAFLELFEAGRWAWMDHHGVRHNAQVLPVVVRIEVDYRKELGVEHIVVQTVLEDAPVDLEDSDTYRVRFRQAVLARDAVVAEALVNVGFIDAETRTLCTLGDFLRSVGTTGR